MSNLNLYNKKRDFSQTAEPKAEKEKDKPASYRFVVQRHDASRLHYDFRLEIDGALKSWAVPKGPSMNPKDKRLAVEVEDHPLSYGSFEGSIPKGNYGAGTVSIFDEGSYDPLETKSDKEFLENWKKGSIKFTLHGKVLKGDFALVRMHTEDGKNWLLIKHQDQYATDKVYNIEDLVSKTIKKEGKDFKEKSKKSLSEKSKKKPDQIQQRSVQPMLATLSENIPSSGEWLFEKKFDGFRTLFFFDGKNRKLLSRNGKPLKEKFPSVYEDLKVIDRPCILDGEVVIEDEKGLAQFQLLQSGEPIPKNLKIHYYVFDILQLDNNDLTAFQLTERKEILDLFLKKYSFKHVRPVKSLDEGKKDLIEFAKKEKWEGVIAKLKNSTYAEASRNGNWLKIKIRNTQEAIICGYTKPEGSRSYFGALVLGIKTPKGLKYIGNCGTGFSEKSLKQLHQLFKNYESNSKPFPNNITVAKEKEVTWLKPELVCDVYYSEWTKEEHLRHPVFKGLRDDKSAFETTKEELDNEVMEKEKELKFGKKTVKLTNLDKIYWPQEKITKGELLNYYETMSEYILPFLKDKPISMNRFPNGIEEKNFFQKDVDPEKIPTWLKTTEVYSESTEKNIDYLLCNDLPSLLYIANLGSIEINPWLSTYKKPDKPEFAVLDLDPNGAKWQDLIDVALTAKEILDKGNIPAFIKTSGSTGLHIFMNMDAKYDYQVIRDFVQFIAELIQQIHPDTTSLVRDPKKRKNLIYLDYLQNKEGQTIVAPYSVRPKPQATVSTPIGWEEVTYDLSIDQFTIHNIYDRVSQKKDPWLEIKKMKVDIKSALAKF